MIRSRKNEQYITIRGVEQENSASLTSQQSVSTKEKQSPTKNQKVFGSAVCQQEAQLEVYYLVSWWMSSAGRDGRPRKIASKLVMQLHVRMRVDIQWRPSTYQTCIFALQYIGVFLRLCLWCVVVRLFAWVWKWRGELVKEGWMGSRWDGLGWDYCGIGGEYTWFDVIDLVGSI